MRDKAFWDTNIIIYLYSEDDELNEMLLVTFGTTMIA